MLCPNCEASNADDARFCDECGFPLSGAIARGTGAASPAAREGERPSGRRKPRAEQPDLRESPSSERDEAVSLEAGYQTPQEDVLSDFRQEAAHDPANPYDQRPAADDALFFDDAPSSQGSYDLYEQLGQDSGRIEPVPSASWQSDDDVDWLADYHAFDDIPSSSADPYDFEPDATARLESGSWSPTSTMQMPRLPEDAPDQSRDFRIEPRRSGPRARTVVIAAVAVLAVIAAALLAAGFALGIIGGKPVPDVTGMTEADARALLDQEGFSVRSTKVKSDGTEGLVLIMDPGAGTRAPEGSEVVIHIATARFIPDVVGKTREEAQALLEEAGYENVKFATRKSEGEENIVLEVSPEPGTRAKGSLEVLVTVSEAYRVPDVSKLDLDAAIATIEDAGLEAEVVYIDTDQFPEGTIMGTNPQAQTKVSGGDTVVISVSRMRGIELVGLTEELFSQGSTVTLGGVDYQIESVISMSYQGDDTVAFTATGRPYVTFFGERLFASSSQTISGTVVWSSDNEVESIS